MKNAYRELIREGLRLGYTCSVWDGGEWQVKRSRSLAACVAAVRSVDEAELRFRDTVGMPVGWALVSDSCDLTPEETVIDHTACDWMDCALAYTLEA
jgi:hypothetical protein